MAGMCPSCRLAVPALARITCPGRNYGTVIYLGDAMLPAAVPVTLTASERKTLKKRVQGAKTPYWDRARARIVLAAAYGRENARIARDLGISENTARKW